MKPMKKWKLLLIFLIGMSFLLAVETYFRQPRLRLPQSGLIMTLPLVLLEIPTVTQDEHGRLADPVNLLFIGSYKKVDTALRQAGWARIHDTRKSALAATVGEIFKKRSYSNFPVSDLYLFGRKQDLAYSKSVKDIRQRHHFRLWKTPFCLPKTKDVWVGAATFDTGILRRGKKLTHTINPDIDQERNWIGQDLESTGKVRALIHARHLWPIYKGVNADDFLYYTDGKILIVVF